MLLHSIDWLTLFDNSAWASLKLLLESMFKFNSIKMFFKFLGFKGENHCSRKTDIMCPTTGKKEQNDRSGGNQLIFVCLQIISKIM